MVEGRLFSEGLHILGQEPSPDNMRSYLSAYFGDRLPEAAIQEVATGGDDQDDIEALRDRLERSFQQVGNDVPEPGDPEQHEAASCAFSSDPAAEIPTKLALRSLAELSTHNVQHPALFALIALSKGEFAICPLAGFADAEFIGRHLPPRQCQTLPRHQQHQSPKAWARP